MGQVGSVSRFDSGSTVPGLMPRPHVALCLSWIFLRGVRNTELFFELWPSCCAMSAKDLLCCGITPDKGIHRVHFGVPTSC